MLHNRVLVLNQNYEPLSVCTAKRAVVLLYLNKAEMVEKNHEVVHSVTLTIPLPSVVRLSNYKRIPRKRVVLNRRNIIRRDNNRCQYCGIVEAQLTIDHVIPRVRGGKDTWENLVCACMRCNTKKGDRTPEEAGMPLMKVPRKPSYHFFIHHIVGAPDDRWKPYLFMT